MHSTVPRVHVYVGTVNVQGELRPTLQVSVFLCFNRWSDSYGISATLSKGFYCKLHLRSWQLLQLIIQAWLFQPHLGVHLDKKLKHTKYFADVNND